MKPTAAPSPHAAAAARPIFDFPGGRRFHFTEPGGSELAAWGDPLA